MTDEPPREEQDQLPPLIRAAQTFASVRKRTAAIYFLAPDEPIGIPNVRELADCIGERKFDELDLVIRSSGGDIHAAYQLICFLRRHVKKLIACVPGYARSAATLLCLGADSIVFDELAALGPLDTQLYAGTTDGGRPQYQSALNQFKNLERLRDFSMETLRTAAEVLHDRGVGPTDTILRYALEFVRSTSTPLYDKIEAQRLGDYSQTLAIGENYGRRLLRRFHGMDKDRIEDVVRQLVHRYPSHEYVIDCQELQELGLVAEVFTGEEQAAARALSRHDSTGLVMLVEPDRSLLEMGAIELRTRFVGSSTNPWRLAPSGSQNDQRATHRAFVSVLPGPHIYDPPPWKKPSQEQETSPSEQEVEK